MKSLIKFYLIALILLVSFASCKVFVEENENISDETKATAVSVSIVSEMARTALPTVDWENYVYTLQARETSTDEKSIVFAKKSFSEISATYSIAVGTYDFILDAFISLKNELNEQAGELVFSGTEKNVNLYDGAKHLSFKMYPAEGGKGGVKIKLFLKDGVEYVKAGISSVPFADEKDCDLLPAARLENKTDAEKRFVEFSADGLSSGSVQYAMFYLYDSRNRLIATLTESIVVVSGSESTSEISESSYNFAFPLSVKLVRESLKKNESDYKGTIYSNGLSLIICSASDSRTREEQTKIYIDENSNGEIDENEKPLEIAGYINFTGWDISSAYYLGNQNLIAENNEVKITIKGGNVRSVSGLNSQNQRSSLYLSGSAKIGSEPVKDSSGNITKVYGAELSTFSDKCAFIDKEMSGNYFVTFITSYDFDSSQVHSVAKLSDANYATLGRVECYKRGEDGTNYTRENLGMKTTSEVGAEIDLARDDDIVIPTNYTKGIRKSSQSLEISKNSSGDIGFSLGEGRIKHSCSVFSVSVANGSFTVGKTKVSDSESGVTYMAQKTETTYETNLDENAKYIYMQVMSSSGQISKEDVSDFLAKVNFIPSKNDDDSFKKMKVKINIETVPFSEIFKGIEDKHTYKDGTSETINQEIMYFDGSFYIRANNKYSKATSAEPNSGGLDRIDECYKKAKQFKFNGLQGYLMTPDSLIESNYIYTAYANKLDNGVKTNSRGWMGAAAIVPTNGWDQDTFEFSEEDGKKGADYFYWICGPNAGKPFWNRKENKKVSDEDFVNWSSESAPKQGDAYNVLQFQGTANGKWNPLKLDDTNYDKDNKPHNDSYWADYYFVEFTPYSNEYTTQTPACAPISNSATIDLNDAKDFINTL